MSNGELLSRRIRVMVVDDSVVTRRVLSETIGAAADLEVVGTAASGRLALAKLDNLSPDIITLDVEMPDMDGLATLTELRKRRPTLPVLMCSTLTERGAGVTMDALALGASDFVTKPGVMTPGGMPAFAQVLIPKLRALGRQRSSAMTGASTTVADGARPVRPMAPPRPAAVVAAPVEVVVLGISTGGPNALAEMIPLIGEALPVPLLIVQHMPPIFTRLLAERLGRLARFPVREAANGDPVLPGQVYVAPGDFHMTVAGNSRERQIVLNTDPPENSCRPSVDVLFRSAAASWRAGVLAVVMTGMGHDGMRGCEAVRAGGGHVLAQDEATSVVWGMPGYVAQAGLADEVLPLQGIAAAIARRVWKAHKAPQGVLSARKG